MDYDNFTCKYKGFDSNLMVQATLEFHVHSDYWNMLYTLVSNLPG